MFLDGLEGTVSVILKLDCLICVALIFMDVNCGTSSYGSASILCRSWCLASCRIWKLSEIITLHTVLSRCLPLMDILYVCFGYVFL